MEPREKSKNRCPLANPEGKGAVDPAAMLGLGARFYDRIERFSPIVFWIFHHNVNEHRK